MTAEMCWGNENRTPMSGFHLDPNLDLPVSGDVAHAFEPHPATGELWTREAERSALVESSAAALHVSWPSWSRSLPDPLDFVCSKCRRSLISVPFAADAGQTWLAAALSLHESRCSA
jgi:hypothetical protein